MDFMNKESTTEKSTTKKSRKKIILGALSALFILLSSVLVYIHDIGDLKKYPGFAGFKSLRTGVYIFSLFTFGLIGWIYAFIRSRNKSDRFMMVAPILMASFQLGIYLFDGRKTTSNEFSTKIILNVVFGVLLIAAYYLGKSRKK